MRHPYKKVTERIIAELESSSWPSWSSYTAQHNKLQVSKARDARIDEFLASTGARIRESDVADNAYYDRFADLITIPTFLRERCGQAEYINTLFHELIHWSAHSTRLNRSFDDDPRAHLIEELIAEFGAAYLCAQFSVTGYVPHVIYIRNQLELFDDPSTVFIAVSKAQAAVDFLQQLMRTCQREICARYSTSCLRKNELSRAEKKAHAKLLHVNPSLISHVRKGRTWA